MADLTVITFAGKADCRVLVYPLVRALRAFGRVVVASDDGAYRRLYHGYGDDGEVSGVPVYVDGLIDYDFVAQASAEYEFLVCVTNGYVPECTTHLVGVTGVDMTLGAGNTRSKEGYGVVNVADEDIIDAPEHVQHVNVVISAQPIDRKRVQNAISYDHRLFTYVTTCEERKALLKVDKVVAEHLSKLFSDFLRIDALTFSRALMAD